MRNIGSIIGYALVAAVGLNVILYGLVWLLVVVSAFSFGNWFWGIMIATALFMLMITRAGAIPIPFTNPRKYYNAVNVFPSVWGPITVVLLITVGLYWVVGKNLVNSMVRHQRTSENAASIEMDQAEREKRLYVVCKKTPLYDEDGSFVLELEFQMIVYNLFEKEEGHGEVLAKVMLPNAQGRFVYGKEYWIAEGDIVPLIEVKKKAAQEQAEANQERRRLDEIVAAEKAWLEAKREEEKRFIILYPQSSTPSRVTFPPPGEGEYVIIEPKTVNVGGAITVGGFGGYRELRAAKGSLRIDDLRLSLKEGDVVKFNLVTSQDGSQVVPVLKLKKF